MESSTKSNWLLEIKQRKEVEVGGFGRGESSDKESAVEKEGEKTQAKIERKRNNKSWISFR